MPRPFPGVQAADVGKTPPASGRRGVRKEVYHDRVAASQCGGTSYRGRRRFSCEGTLTSQHDLDSISLVAAVSGSGHCRAKQLTDIGCLGVVCLISLRNSGRKCGANVSVVFVKST